MAASSTKMRLHQGPVDVWSIREKLALACSVMKSGDQNWVSVSRAIKPYMEVSRPANWFSQKNCALQYSDLLEKVETPKRKRGDGGEIDTPADQIFRKLMTERIEELRKIALDEQQRYKKLKREVECIKSGQYDDRLSEVWEQMQAEKAEEEAAREAEKKAIEEARTLAQAGRGLGPKRLSVTSQSSLSEQEETQDSYTEFPLLEIPKLGDDETPSLSLTPESLGVTTQQPNKSVPPTSPLLSSLLQSKLKSANSLQQLKNEAEQAEALTQQHKVQQIALQLKQSAESAVSQLQQSAELAGQSREAGQVREMGGAMKELTEEALVNQVAALSQVRDLLTPQLQQQVKSIAAHTESLPTSPSCAAPTLSKLLFNSTQPKPLTDVQVSTLSGVTTTPIITVTKVATTTLEGAETSESKTLSEPAEQDSADESITVDVTAELSSTEGDVPEGSCDQSCDASGGKVQTAYDDGTNDEMAQSDFTSQSRVERTPVGPEDEDCSSFLSVDEEVSIKEDPPSPASSVSSKVSESGGKNVYRRGRRGRGRGRRGRTARRSVQEDDKKDDASSKHSDVDLSDDEELRESDDPMPAGSLFSESIPNSPASLSMCSDTEDEKAFKTWKKSIMLVWRSAANHKYANVFLHPVTNEIAPGYKGIVHRPMDLGTIKKNIENGGLRTTSEFQRDMMLMFTNAIMYNNTDQPVFKMATEMYNDVMQHIEQYVSTQLMVQSSETKVLRQSRRGELQEKEEEGKKRRTSSEQPLEGGKTKKRKTRADDT